MRTSAWAWIAAALIGGCGTVVADGGEAWCPPVECPMGMVPFDGGPCDCTLPPTMPQHCCTPAGDGGTP